MITVSVRGLPAEMTEDGLVEMFASFGKVHQMKMARDLFSGACKGFAEVQMEGHEARAAIEGLDGKAAEGGFLRVGVSKPGGGRRGRR